MKSLWVADAVPSTAEWSASHFAWAHCQWLYMCNVLETCVLKPSSCMPCLCAHCVPCFHRFTGLSLSPSTDLRPRGVWMPFKWMPCYHISKAGNQSMKEVGVGGLASA
jgi:hypothetical protein